MEGMTLNQFNTIVEFIQKYHRFGIMPRDEKPLRTETGFKHHHDIRYIDCTYDTLTPDVWAVKLRGPRFNYRFAINEEVSEDFKYSKLYDWVMAFLKGEWSPPECMKKKIIEKI